jgi:hypothetical protein
LEILFQNDTDEAGTLSDGLENYFGVVFGLGGLDGLHGHLQSPAETKEAAMAQIILKPVGALVDFGL